MSYILFFLIYFLIKIFSVSCTSSSKYFQILKNININNYLAENNPNELLYKIENCLNSYTNNTFENRTYILGKCVINATKGNVDELALILKDPLIYLTIREQYPNLDSIDKTGRLKRFFYALNESAYNQSHILIDLLYNSFSIKDELNPHSSARLIALSNPLSNSVLSWASDEIIIFPPILFISLKRILLGNILFL